MNENKPQSSTQPKKSLKNIIIIMGLVLIIIVILLFMNSNKKEKEHLQNHEIKNINEISYNFSDFVVDINGTYQIAFSKTILMSENVPIYEFDAGIFNGWEVKTDHYIGVKVIDVLNIYELQDFVDMKIVNEDGNTIVYKNTDINDNTYFIFERNGKPFIKENSVSIINFDKDYRDSIQNILIMTINRENQENNDIEENQENNDTGEGGEE